VANFEKKKTNKESWDECVWYCGGCCGCGLKKIIL
jgi:hypothetical protein